MTEKSTAAAKPRLAWHRAEPGVLVVEGADLLERYAVLRHTGLYPGEVVPTCNVCLDLLADGRKTCHRGPWSVAVQETDGAQADPDDWFWHIQDEPRVGLSTAREAKLWAESQVLT